MKDVTEFRLVPESGIHVWALLVCLFILMQTAHPSDINWTNTAGGDWSVATNWSPNSVPGLGDNVSITNAGNYTVTLNVSATVSNLTMGAVSGTQTFSNSVSDLTLRAAASFGPNAIVSWGGGTWTGTNIFSGTFQWSGGVLSGFSTVTTGALVNLNGSSSKTYLGTLTNAGTIQIVGSGNLNVGSSFIYNLAGALFDFQTNQTLDGFANAPFDNAGTLRKSAGDGTTFFNMILRNTGGIEVESGTIQFDYGGNLGGTFAAAVGKTIFFADGTCIFDAMPNFSGTVTFGPGAGLHFTVPISNFTLTSGVLSGTNVITGTLNWTGGQIGGICTVATGAVMNITGSDGKSQTGTLTNAGTINVTGPGFSGNSTYNQAGALFDIKGDYTVGGPGGVEFNNAGTLRKSAGAGTSSFQLFLRNTGTVEVQNGTFNFVRNASMGGSFTAAVGQTINFGGACTFNAMPNFSGTVTFGPGAALFFTVPITNFTLTGGVLSGTNVITGTLNWTGGQIGGICTVATGAVMNITGSDGKSQTGTLTNAGTINVTGSGFSGNSTYNQAGALFDIKGDYTVGGPGGVEFNNAGTLRKSAGAGTSSFQLFLRNTGTVEVQSGTLDFGRDANMGGSFTAAVGQTINFGGACVFEAMPNFSGTVTFGPGAGLYFTVPISNFTLTSGTLAGTNTITGTLNWTGGAIGGFCTIATGAVVNVSGPGSAGFGNVTVTNFGIVNVVTNLGGLSWFFYNQPGGVFDIQGDVTVSGFANATFYNAGVFRKSVGPGTTTIGLVFYNSGVEEVQTGILQFSGSLSNAPSSVLSCPIAGRGPGADYGRLAVVGTFQLAGALNIVLTNGFVPSVGDSFRILDWGTRRGGFTQANGFDLGNGLYFQGIADRSGLSLITKTTVVPIPPPPTNLVNQVVAIGDTAAFSLLPAGLEPFTYQWTFNGTNLVGQTNASLVLANVQGTNLGTYCVVVVDALNVTNTYCATLSALTPPGITTQPAGQTVSPGANITLTATANGGAPLRYQWRLNGANIPGATNSTYTITNAQPRDGGIYSVLVANPVRVISSSNAKVLVLSPALPFADNFASRGTTNSFSGVGSGSNTNATHESGEPNHAGKPGTHSVWLQWTAPANGVATFNTRGSSFDTLLGVYTSTNSPSVTNLTLVASDDDRGDYFTSEAVFNAVAGTNYQIAVDGLSSASGDLVLSWNLDTNVTQIPRIIQQPLDATVAAGGTATFSVFAASTTNLSYQWYLGDWLAIPGATTNTLTVTNVSYLNVGTYSVEITSATGQTVESLSASLEIGAAADVHSFDKLEDLLQAIQSGGGGGFAPPLKKGGGVTAPSLSFPSVSAGTLGSQIINNFNSTTEQGEPIHSDVIGGSSRWYLLTAATNGTLVIDTLGSDIDTVLSVYTGSDILSLQLVASDNNGASDGVRSLVRIEAQAETNYLIAVDGVNGAQGNINLNWRLGTVPVYSGTFVNPKLLEGAGLVLESGVTNGFPPPAYQWRRNGVNLSGATNASYTLASVRYDQVGNYSVVASNLVGAITNLVAALNVQSPLRLALAPSGVQLSGSATQGVVLQLSTNLTQWTPLFTNAYPILPVVYQDTNSVFQSKGYYRLLPWP